MSLLLISAVIALKACCCAGAVLKREDMTVEGRDMTEWNKPGKTISRISTAYMRSPSEELEREDESCLVGEELMIVI